jgi:2-dehydro-3-deoxyphosphogalactonate aldolase
MKTKLSNAMSECGLIAILRGIRPEEAAETGQALYAAGFRIIEVPLNSFQPFESIRKMRASLPPDCVVGAGTVYQSGQIAEVLRAGGELIVMPHSDRIAIETALSSGLAVIPGVATPTEAFAALSTGCSFLKFFPADHLGPSSLKAWISVLPAEARLLPVGGITTTNLAEYLKAGASGFGLGSALYKPGMTSKSIADRGTEFVFAWRNGFADFGRYRRSVGSQT